MQKNKIKSVLYLVTGSIFLLSSSVLASNFYGLSHECASIARDLRFLAQKKPNDACSGDLLIAASYIESAGERISYGKYKLAVIPMGYGISELKGISLFRAYCSNFSSEVKPILGEAIKVASELDKLANPDLLMKDKN